MTPGEAALKIRGLVCGLPGIRARRRHLLMLKEYKAFVDGSGTGDPNLLVLGGYVAPTEIWEEFSKEWQARLNHAGIPYFKMNQMASHPEIAGYFYRVIEEWNVTAAIACLVDTAALRRVVRTFKWPPEIIIELRRLENPYGMAFQGIIEDFAQNQHKLKIDEPVDFIFDEESEEAAVLEGWDWIKVGNSVDSSYTKFIGGRPTFLDDKKVLPLQAADLWAWWIRKWEIERIKDGVKYLKFPWGAQREIPRLHMHYKEKDFLRMFNEITPEAINSFLCTDPKAILRARKIREEGIKMSYPDPSSGWGRPWNYK